MALTEEDIRRIMASQKLGSKDVEQVAIQAGSVDGQGEGCRGSQRQVEDRNCEPLTECPLCHTDFATAASYRRHYLAVHGRGELTLVGKFHLYVDPHGNFWHMQV